MKRNSLEIKKKILFFLSKEKYLSYGNLERKVNTNWNTIRNYCYEFEIYGFIKKDINGISITNSGKEILKKLEKN